MDTEQIRTLEQIRAWVATRRQPVPRLLTQTSYESTALHHIDDLLAAIDDLEAEKAAVYRERDQIVAVLSKLWPSHLAKHLGEWEDDWRNIVCIHSPVGQVSWHIHDSEMSLFNHLEITLSDWDGHTTPEKYERLSEWPGL